jgi:hypothetical protein
MSFLGQTHRAPEDLRREIRRLDTVTGEVASAALDLVLAHCAAANRAEQARRIRELIGSKAWTDAGLAMVELARSRAVRRLSREDGEWHCTIGSQWPVPDWLDDSVEFSHAVLPLAILGALIDALGRGQAAIAPATSVPQSRSDLRDSIAAVSCDNYL